MMRSNSSKRPLALLLFALAAGCGAYDSPTTDEQPAYRHPLQGLGSAGEGVPGVDVKDAPDGARWAVVESLTASDDSERTGEATAASGVQRLARWRLTAAERAELQRSKRRPVGEASPAEPVATAPKLGPSLAAMAADSRSSDVPHEVLIRLADPGAGTLALDLERAVASGVIRTAADREQERERLLDARRASIRAAQTPVVAAIQGMSGLVTYRCENMYCLSAKLAPAAAATLTKRADVIRIDLATEDHDDANIDGDLVCRGTQIKPIVDAGWDGERLDGSADDIYVAVVEAGGVDDEHPGFRDDSGAASRIGNRYECTDVGCSLVANFASEATHASSVAGIIIGDLRDGQDPSWPGATDRLARSGYAGEAYAHVYAKGSSSSATRKAFDHMIGASPFARVANFSGSSTTDDPSCLGETAYSQDANDLFESGILLFKTAGNSGFSNASDCTIGSPGSAIGVFTVGGHGTAAIGDENSVRAGSIYPSTSRGGVSLTEGKNRSIVDMTAYAYRYNMFDTAGGYSVVSNGTSYSAPTVTAGAVDFIDFYKDIHSNLIDNPGILFANLLLMGDRQGAGGKVSSLYDNLWGAGRLKMRRWSNYGLDAPFQWQTGFTCVDHGEVYSIPVNSGAALSADVNMMKAVVFWYDRRHETGVAIDDIDLRLKTTSGAVLASSLSDFDNKERVYSTLVGGQAVTLEITGSSVTSDVEGCGTNSMKVYWAYFFEDSDRDDADGPGPEVEAE